ncbi:MAG: hypothetical protein OHK0012_21860 [Synechococcales cyanobacterium]
MGLWRRLVVLAFLIMLSACGSGGTGIIDPGLPPLPSVGDITVRGAGSTVDVAVRFPQTAISRLEPTPENGTSSIPFGTDQVRFFIESVTPGITYSAEQFLDRTTPSARFEAVPPQATINIVVEALENSGEGSFVIASAQRTLTPTETEPVRLSLVANSDIPRLTGITPTSVAPGATVTFLGSGLEFAQAAFFSTAGSNPPVEAVVSTGTAIVPTNAVSGKVIVLNGNGNGLGVAQLTVIPPASTPVISSVNPAGGQFAGSEVTITGVNFLGATVVSFAGEPVTLDPPSASDSTITVTIPATVAAGDIDLTVTTPTGGESAPFVYTILPPTPVITISSISPANSARVGTPLTISGTNFAGATIVSFGAVDVTIPANVSNTVIFVTIPSNAPLGTDIEITVTGPTGTSAPFLYEILPALPAISSITPATGAPANTEIIINGSNFSDPSQVSFGGAIVTATTVTPSAITVTTPNTLLPGNIDVIVTTASGDSNAFSYPIIPIISGVSPLSGTSGTTVSIDGGPFVDGSTSVLFGGTAGTAVNVIDATLLSVQVPFLGTTAANIPITVVVNGATSEASASPFSYSPPVVVLETSLDRPIDVTQIGGMLYIAGELNTTFNKNIIEYDIAAGQISRRLLASGTDPQLTGIIADPAVANSLLVGDISGAIRRVDIGTEATTPFFDLGVNGRVGGMVYDSFANELVVVDAENRRIRFINVSTGVENTPRLIDLTTFTPISPAFIPVDIALGNAGDFILTLKNPLDGAAQNGQVWRIAPPTTAIQLTNLRSPTGIDFFNNKIFFTGQRNTAESAAGNLYRIDDLFAATTPTLLAQINGAGSRTIAGLVVSDANTIYTVETGLNAAEGRLIQINLP